MEKLKIKKEIVAVFMESPLYFDIPLKKRLEFIMFFSQQPIYNQICELNVHQMLGKRFGKTLGLNQLKKPEIVLLTDAHAR